MDNEDGDADGDDDADGNIAVVVIVVVMVVSEPVCIVVSRMAPPLPALLSASAAPGGPVGWRRSPRRRKIEN